MVITSCIYIQWGFIYFVAKIKKNGLNNLTQSDIIQGQLFMEKTTGQVLVKIEETVRFLFRLRQQRSANLLCLL